MDNQSDLFDVAERPLVDEINWLKDLNRRLVAGAHELRDATDAAEFDNAWSKLYALIQESK